jgi:transposase
MKFVGVDLHKQSSTVAVVSAPGEKSRTRRFGHTQTAFLAEFFQSLGEFQVTVEATASYEWFVRLVEPFAQRVILAHPGKLRIIAESTRKSDKLDARVLADMLARDQIPPAYRPTPRQRDHRRLVRQRVFWQRKITAVRNKLRHLLADYNADRKDLSTGIGQGHLDQVSLTAHERFCADQLVREWKHDLEQLAASDARLREFGAEGSPQERRDREWLQTIPGVGIVTSDVLLSELADPRRFSSAKEAVAYAGLVPGQRESAGQRKSLHIEKTGSPLLRWALVQSAWQLVRCSPHWSRIHERLAARIGKKKATIAVARRLLCVSFAILRDQQPYREQPPIPAGDLADDRRACVPSRRAKAMTH